MIKHNCLGNDDLAWLMENHILVLMVNAKHIQRERGGEITHTYKDGWMNEREKRQRDITYTYKYN